ncbi:hypothetical protein BHM03_00022675 [Ensete ventricosum]|nr:hypothetical protein BHM03_00022675 [Ensete ventricosum]
MAQKLQQQLKEVGSKLENPPASKDALIKLLKVGASSRIWDSFLSMSFLFEIKKREKKRRAWISSRVAQFVARSPRVVRSVARFPRVARFVSPHGEKKRLPSWGERTRRPCGIKDIFHLIVGTFAGLGDINSPSFRRRAVILETLAKYRSCVVMLDLELNDLIHEMFRIFVSAVR